MPELSRFYGIVIYINPRDHLPPHFHAEYGEHEAAVEIATGAVLAGHLPSRAWRLVQEWFDLHRAEVEENWRLIQGGRRFFRVEPL